LSRNGEWRYREATRLFLFDLLSRGEGPDDVLYVLGRMQGRQWLWQRCPQWPDYWCWLDEPTNQGEDE
jgi:hypothetical protein